VNNSIVDIREVIRLLALGGFRGNRGRRGLDSIDIYIVVNILLGLESFSYTLINKAFDINLR
jgi:hypothetical protein